MNAEGLILAILSELPEHQIRGKTRLQKLAYFVADAGAADVGFYLHNYGPLACTRFR